MKKLLILLGLFALVVSCVSNPKQLSKTAMPYKPPPLLKPLSSNSSPHAEQINVDVPGLKRFLHLDRREDQLGYSEHMFNTCQVGFGYSSTHNCEKKFFVVSHFRLQCRDSEGTISQILTEADLRPISRQEINWTLKNANGTVLTDSEGYAQIHLISKESQRQQRMKLSNGNDFLYLKAVELTQMTTPKNWCR